MVPQPNGEVRSVSGSCPETTSNRMEMTAVLMALRDANPEHSTVLRTDSQLIVRSLEGRYQRNANLDLWGQIDTERARFKDLSFEWIKGHAGDPYNELADKLANKAAGIAEGSLPATRATHGTRKRGLRCNQCRQPMDPIPRPSNVGAQSGEWFQCSYCDVQGYKDRQGAHYMPRISPPLPSRPTTDPFAITASVDPAFEKLPSSWRRKHQRKPD